MSQLRFWSIKRLIWLIFGGNIKVWTENLVLKICENQPKTRHQYAIPKIHMLCNLCCLKTRLRLLCDKYQWHSSLNFVSQQLKLFNIFIFGMAYFGTSWIKLIIHTAAFIQFVMPFSLTNCKKCQEFMKYCHIFCTNRLEWNKTWKKQHKTNATLGMIQGNSWGYPVFDRFSQIFNKKSLVQTLIF